MPTAAPLPIAPDDLAVLRRWACAGQLPAVLAQRAKILMLTAEGIANTEAADRVGVTCQTVLACRRRYRQGGLAGLPDRPRSGRPQTVRRTRRAEILAATLNPPPARLGITHWSTRLLAGELGVGRDTVARIWREYHIQPWRAETFKFSTDPDLVAKVNDVVGLYLQPPERAVVLCVDEKPQIQALQRTRPVRRVVPGRPSSAPTTMYATALPRCLPPWRSPPGGSPTSASHAIGTRSSSPSASWSPGPTPASGCT
jgi:transposase